MRKKIAIGLALIAALFIVTVVYAEYTGPQRGSHRVCGAPHNLYYVANGMHRYICSYKTRCGTGRIKVSNAIQTRTSKTCVTI